MPRVLFTPTLRRDSNQPYFRLLAESGFEVVFPPAGVNTFDPAVLTPLLRECHAMLASTEPLTAAILEQCPQLRVIARWGVGYDAIDIPSATRLGIVVTITPGVLEESVAEHTIALMLGVTRGLVQRDREVRRGIWSREVLPRLAGKTLGLVGLGRIGRLVALKALALGMRVWAYDPLADASFCQQHVVRQVSLDEIWAECDVISLHAPCTPQTENLINAGTLARMKQGAVLVNTSRGGLIDEAALCDALRSGHLLGAALDVYQREPLATTSPLCELDNVLLCTHMGGLDSETAIDAPRLAAQCIIDLSRGAWPSACVVNRELEHGWKW